jgi:large subunit ribosomal protein L28
MAKVCELCGKSTIAGKRIQHHHSIGWKYKAPRSVRTFKPNLRKLKVNVEGNSKRIDVCMKCYKRLKLESEK